MIIIDPERIPYGKMLTHTLITKPQLHMSKQYYSSINQIHIYYIYIYIYIYGSEDGGNLLSIKKEECTGWNIHTSWVKRQQYFQSHKYMS